MGGGFVDQQPVTGCHSTHTQLPNQPGGRANLTFPSVSGLPHSLIWPENNQTVTLTINKKKSIKICSFYNVLVLFTDIHTAPLFSTHSSLWGFVGGKLGFSFLDWNYNSMRVPFCFVLSQESILSSNCWHKERLSMWAPLLNMKKPHQRACVCPLLTFKRSSKMLNTCGWALCLG